MRERRAERTEWEGQERASRVGGDTAAVATQPQWRHGRSGDTAAVAARPHVVGDNTAPSAAKAITAPRKLSRLVAHTPAMRIDVSGLGRRNHPCRLESQQGQQRFGSETLEQGSSGKRTGLGTDARARAC